MNDILYNIALHSDITTLKQLYQTSHGVQQLFDKHFWTNKLSHDNLFIPTINDTYDWFKIYDVIVLIQENIDVHYNFLVIINIIDSRQEQLRQLLHFYGVVVSFDISYISYINNNVSIRSKKNNIEINIHETHEKIVNIIFDAYMKGLIDDFTKI